MLEIEYPPSKKKWDKEVCMLDQGKYELQILTIYSIYKKTVDK